MNKKKEIIAVYTAGLIQGLALVAFPAAGGILTSPSDFNLSSTAYGSLFIPQAILSITASLFSAKLSARKGSKTIFLFGLIANLLAMALLTSSALIMKQPSAYAVLLIATAFLGLGFGLTVPALNAFTVHFFLKKCDKALLLLNALLGLGMAISPVLIALFVGFGIWWGLPLLLTSALFILFLYTFPLSFPQEKKEPPNRSSFPLHFWLFALFAFLYGIVETVNGNWGAIYMKKVLHSSSSIALISLTLFWAMVTLGRLFFAAIERIIPETLTFRFLPIVIAGALLITSHLSPTGSALESAAFALAGLGCSALLPLTIGLAGKALPSIAPSTIAGGMIAFYLFGYGVAAFGVGPLLNSNIDLSTIFKFSSFIALALAILAFAALHRKKARH